MKLGFLTACLPTWSLEKIADYAVEQGYETLEVACWPGGPATRDFEASHIDVNNLDHLAATARDPALEGAWRRLSRDRSRGRADRLRQGPRQTA